MEPKNVWPAVVLVVSVLAGVVALAFFRVEQGTVERLIPLLVIPLLIALLGKASQIQHQTNGTTDKLMTMHREQLEENKRLTDLIARSPALRPEEVPSPEGGGVREPRTARTDQ